MKLVNSSKSLAAACALSLAMGIAGSVQADHKGEPHGNGGNGGKGPQFSIDVETFCGYPSAEEFTVLGEFVQDFGTNAAVRVTDVSDDTPFEDPRVAVDILCLAAVKNGPGKPEMVQFDGESFPMDTVAGARVYTYDCKLEQLPAGATEWKATALVTGDELKRDVFDSCEEVAVP